MAQISSGSLTIVDVADSVSGINTATLYLYQRAASAPARPSSDLTYNFTTAELSGVLGSWTRNLGELTSTYPIWITAAVASSNGTTDVIAPGEWTTPTKMAEDGKAGVNQATVYIYQRATGTPSTPSSVTYTFANGNFTVPTNWSKQVPTSNGKPCWVSSAVAIGNGATAQLNWTAPSVLAEDGTDGKSPTVTPTTNGVIIHDPINNVDYTITNGADGTQYYTHIRYSKNSNGSGYVTQPTSETKYIGVYSGTSKTAPAYNAAGWTWSLYVGANGTNGTNGTNGVSVTGTRELYYLKTNSTTVSKITASSQIATTDKVNGWTSIVPTYVVNGSYYTCIETSLSSGGPVWSNPIENKGLTTANYNAAVAKSVSEGVSADALGALSIARGVRQHFFNFPTDVNANIPAGSYIAEENEDAFKAGPNKGNLLTRSDGIWIRNGKNTLASLISGGLSFFVPNGTLQGKLGMKLDASSLTFYNIDATNSKAAILSATGLVLNHGGIYGGSTSDLNKFVYISTDDFGSKFKVNNHEVTDWRLLVNNKFGVDKAGNLYASGAVISGTIEAGSGSNILTSVTSKDQYYLSTSSSSATGGSWQDTVPTWSSGKYIWTRVATTKTTPDGDSIAYSTGVYDKALTDALSTASSAQSTANSAASSVVTTKEYNLSSSTSTANGTWSTTVPTWASGKYIWIRFKIVKTPMSGTATTSYSPSVNGQYDSALTTALSTAADAKTTANNAAPKSSAIAEEQRIYYRSNSNTKPNGNGLPTAWVTETGNKYNTNATTAAGWSRKITPISTGTSDTTKYLYLWTCIQKKTVSGTVTYGDILLDDSTTVIDGGKIITGSIDANKINVTDLSAFKAKIGGWHIDTGKIYSYANASTVVEDGANALYYTYIQSTPGSSGGNLAFGVRARTSSQQQANNPVITNSPLVFGVTHAGSLTATKGTIAGWNISSTALCSATTYSPASGRILLAPAGIQITSKIGILPAGTWTITASDKFGVTTAGKLYATEAVITGTLTASSGSKIGPWTIADTAIWKGNATHGTAGTGNMYFGNNGLSISNTFKVSNAGVLTATGATIGGTITTSNITATGGTIGGWTLDANRIYKYANSAGATVTSDKAKYYVYIQSNAGSSGGNYAFALRTRTDAQVTANSPAIGSADVLFGVAWNGSMSAKNATIEGVIRAKSGYIGYGATNKIAIGTNTTNASIYSGSHSALNSAANGFYVGADGIAIGPYNSTSGITSCPFQVTSAGYLTARYGRIGKFTLSNTYLYSGTGSNQAGMGADTIAFWAGSNTETSAPFRVTYQGALTATKATIAGTITANAGTIGGFRISGSYLRSFATNSGTITTGTDAEAEAQATRYTLMQSSAGGGGNVAFGVATRSSTSASWDWTTYMAHNGAFIAKNASITGTVTATSFTAKSGNDVVATFGGEIVLGNTGAGKYNILLEKVITGASLKFRKSTTVKAGISWSDDDRYSEFYCLGGGEIAMAYRNTSNVQQTYISCQKNRIDIDGNKDVYIVGTMWTDAIEVGGKATFDDVSTTTSSANARLGTNDPVGRLYRYSSSSQRYKHDIKNLDDKTIEASCLYNLDVKQFKYNKDYLTEEDIRFDKDIPGFIAEDVYDIYPIAADLDDNGNPEDWNVRYIVPPMLKLIQEQHEEIEQLKQEVQELKNK